MQVKQSFWLKLSAILLIGTLCFCFSIAWFFSVHHAHRLNVQSQLYLSERFSFLYKHINSYVKKTTTPSFSRIQRIISIYSDKTSSKSSFFLINESGVFVAHSKTNYKKTYLPKTSPLYAFIKKYPAGWGPVSRLNRFSSLISVARPITISSVKYLVIISHPSEQPLYLFLSYFKWILLFSFMAFIFLFLLIFLYLRSFAQAAHFLFHLFGDKYTIEQKKVFSYLAHTNNFYLKKIQPVLTVLFQKVQKKKKQNSSYLEVSVFDLIEKIIHQSQLFYPNLQIHKELNADINLPVFSDLFFQSLWELVKNAVQAHTATSKITSSKNNSFQQFKKNAIIIRTFKKQNTWFCCEVEDKGPGMNKTTMKQATQLYFTTKTQATGLGLPFVQSVLSRIGGVMKLQSSEKEGLKVSLFIPLDYINYIHNLKTSSQKKYREVCLTTPESEKSLHLDASR